MDVVARIAVLEAQRVSDLEALKLQAIEYERRLSDLNHAHERAAEERISTITVEKFDTFRAGDLKAQELALQRQDDINKGLNNRISDLENWKSKASGVGAVLVLVAGFVGAAISKILGV